MASLEAGMATADSGGGVGSNSEPSGTAAEGPAAQLAEFKAHRQRKQRRTSLIMLSVGLAVAVLGMFWGMVMLVLFGNTEARNLGLFVMMTGLALIYLSNFDWAKEFAEISLRRPSLELAICCLWYVNECMNSWSYGNKYGVWLCLPRWFAVAWPLVLAVPAILKGGSPFEAVPLREGSGGFCSGRRWTFCEFIALLWGGFLPMYILTDLFCTLSGQWDGSRLGAVGGLLMVLLDVAISYHYIHVVCMPVAGARPMPEGMRHANVMKYMFFGYAFRTAFLSVCRGVLAGDVGLQLHLDFDATRPTQVRMSGSEWTAFFSFEMALGFSATTSLIYWKQREIVQFISVISDRKRRLLDGAFVAALMADDTESSKGDLINEAASLIRRVPMGSVSLSLLSSSPRDLSYSADEGYALNERCGLGGIDFFGARSLAF